MTCAFCLAVHAATANTHRMEQPGNFDSCLDCREAVTIVNGFAACAPCALDVAGMTAAALMMGKR